MSEAQGRRKSERGRARREVGTPLSVGIPYEEKDRRQHREQPFFHRPSPPPDHAFSTYRHNCHNIVPLLPHTYSLLLHIHTPASVPSPTLPFPSSPETASFPRRVDRKFNRRFFRLFPTSVSTIFEPGLISGETYLFIASDALAFRDRYEDLTRFKGVTRWMEKRNVNGNVKSIFLKFTQFTSPKLQAVRSRSIREERK